MELPSNSKSMFSLLCMYMQKLDSAEIDVSQAVAMSRLVGEARSMLEYELKRAALMCNDNFKKEHRNLEFKKFDSLPE